VIRKGQSGGFDNHSNDLFPWLNACGDSSLDHGLIEPWLAGNSRYCPKVQYAAARSFGNLALFQQVSYGAARPDIYFSVRYVSKQ
jgi:hypothetical protein